MTVSTFEAQRDFLAWQQRARIELVTVTDNGQTVSVLMSVEVYRRLKRRDRQAIRVEMLDDATHEALAATKPPEEAARYDFEAC